MKGSVFSLQWWRGSDLRKGEGEDCEGEVESVGVE